MSRKTGATTSLSNGTLSLRFMQRGTTQKVTATSAKIVDEAEWDIGPTARAAWGVAPAVNPGPTAQPTLIHVTRDDSYLPFVFDRGTPDTTNQEPSADELQTVPARRRIFRKGTEIKHEVSPTEVTDSNNESEKSGTKAESDIKAAVSSDVVKPQPKSISGPRKANDTQVTNKPGIRRHRLEELIKPSAPSTTSFLKPTGVSSASNTSTKRSREDNVATRRGKIMKTG
ncbi:hypothetical protein OPQ81_002400 [Rhizoctonia solani]|nr:hypothetical protein OPQ81_002400 [Rhizoctonia solani]